MTTHSANNPDHAELPLTEQSPPQEHRNFILRFIDWLRIGYPAGVSDTDASAILYVLKHQLTDEDITRVAQAIITAQGEDAPLADNLISEAEINHYIERTMSQKPTPEDLERVREKLSSAGFPVENAE